MSGSTHLWSLSIAGTAATAKPVAAALSDEQAITGVIALLKSLTEIGPRARGRDLDAEVLREQFQFDEAKMGNARGPSVSPIGIISLDETRNALGLRPSFGQIHAADLRRFLAVAETAGVSEIRTAPDHALLLLWLTPGAMEHVRTTAASGGFRTRADDPANYAIPCSGAGACASAH